MASGESMGIWVAPTNFMFRREGGTNVLAQPNSQVPPDHRI